MRVETSLSDMTQFERESNVKKTPQIRANKNEFDRDGFLMIRDFVHPCDLSWIIEQIDGLNHENGTRSRRGESFAIRDVFAASPTLLDFACVQPLSGLATALLGRPAWPTKATLFDKRPEANWALPLHQDLTITVHASVPAPGFGPWTEKAGVPHVQPPESVLRSIVALRIHLDDCPTENGALRVVRGSHKDGKLRPDARGKISDTLKAESAPANAGDVLAMSPLLVHGSGKSERPEHRRVLHVEYSCEQLPSPLQWPQWSTKS